MNENRQKLKDLTPLLLMAALALILGALLFSGTVTVDGILALVAENRPAAIAILLALYALKGCSAVIIFDVLVVAAGVLFELPLAIAVNCVGLAICLSVSYAIGFFTKTRTPEAVLAKHPKLARYFRTAKDEGFLFCFTLHTLNLSLEAQGVLFGLLKIPYWKYLTGSFLAVAPGMLCFTIFGREFGFQNPAFWVILAINLCMIALGVWYTQKRLRTDDAAARAEAAPTGAAPMDAVLMDAARVDTASTDAAPADDVNAP